MNRFMKQQKYPRKSGMPCGDQGPTSRFNLVESKFRIRARAAAARAAASAPCEISADSNLSPRRAHVAGR